jgi:outer membrane receptor protein involved in Fe transport
MQRNLLAAAIGTILALSVVPELALAQDPTDADADSQDAEASELETIRVTGSLIPQAQKETASPVTIITAEEIETHGFRSVYDALRSQPLATGAVQDGQFSGGFTAGASTVSLLGLRPAFTLILIDGRPMADYPLLYNGQSNFVDLTSIPAAMVERIDILPGNNSAIYGSSAIAGVINIILKKRIEGMALNLRAGGFDDGGGSNQRLQFTGGFNTDALEFTYGLQLSRQDPVYFRDREWSDSTEDNPNPAQRFGSRAFLVLDGFTGDYHDPGAAACAPLAGNFGGSVIYETRPGFGNYCGSRAVPGYASMLNKEEANALYTNLSYRISDSTEVYASLLYGVNKAENDGGSRFWSPDINGSGGYIFDQSTGGLDLYQHIFSPEETGGANNSIDRSHTFNAALGLRGVFGDSNWDYEAYYARSQYDLESRQLWPLTGPIENFFRDQFLGPQLGTYYGYSVYEPNRAGFYQSLTPQQYRSFLGQMQTDSRSWTHNFNFNVTNTSLFELPAGSVAMAGLLQGGYSHWSNPTDPRVLAGDFWGITGTQGGGDRSNMAAATEFMVPIFSTLSANVSGRYDRYKNEGGGSDSDFTYKLGLEFRPADTLLIRGNVATAFRAPDMAYTFAGDSGFFTTVTDYYRCDLEDQPLEDCDYLANQNIQGVRRGDPALTSITADSYGAGVVWSPTQEFNVRVDYYNVDIQDDVVDLSINQLLLDEASCRASSSPNSEQCLEVYSHIDRNAPDAPFQPNQLNGVNVNPINAASESVEGIIAGSTYNWDTDRAGQFVFGLDYNLTLNHEFQEFSFSDVDDYRNNGFQSTEFRSIVTGDIAWTFGKWSVALHGLRLGSTPNYTAQLFDPTIPGNGDATNNGIGRARIAPYLLYNLNIGYDLNESSALALTVNNLRNSAPPKDRSYTAFPYYNIFNYNGVGRSYWLTYDLKFDAFE